MQMDNHLFVLLVGRAQEEVIAENTRGIRGKIEMNDRRIIH